MKNTNLILFSILGVFISSHVFAEFLFKPNGCEFSVVFPEKPAIEVYRTDDGNECKTTAAYLLKSGQKGGLKAECTVCQYHNVNNINEETMTQMLKGHALSSGVSRVAYSYQETALGKIGIYRGEISGLKSTISVVNIVGKKSAFSITGSAPYAEYPTLGFTKFKDSVKKN